jgi:hypothetical protein
MTTNLLAEKPTDGMTVRIPTQLKLRVDTWCRHNDQSRSQLVRRLLAGYAPLADIEPEPVPEKPQWQYTR